MELKISHGSILFWRAGAPPPPQAPPPHQYASVDTTHPQERLPSQSPFQDSSNPPPSLSLSLSLSHMVHPQTYCISTSPCKPTLTSSIKTYIVHYKSKIKLIIWYLPFYCTLVVVMLLLSFLFCCLQAKRKSTFIMNTQILNLCVKTLAQYETIKGRQSKMWLSLRGWWWKLETVVISLAYTDDNRYGLFNRVLHSESFWIRRMVRIKSVMRVTYWILRNTYLYK